LDVLDQLEEIKICVAYKYNGKIIEEFPADMNILEEIEPIYETMPGWQQDTSGMKTFEELPEKAKDYLQKISELTGAKIAIVSVGQARSQTIFKMTL
jgi:adenylosuccinate synthase